MCISFSFHFVLNVVGLWLLMIESGLFPHVKRGFFCDDRSIAMHYNGETVSTAAILSTILLVYPILWICEACYFIPVSLKSSRAIESARRAWRWFKEYLFGMVLHLFIVDGIKVRSDHIRDWLHFCCEINIYSNPFCVSFVNCAIIS